jgi:hypothetical protein
MPCQVAAVDLANLGIFHIQIECGHYLGYIPTYDAHDLVAVQNSPPS